MQSFQDILTFLGVNNIRDPSVIFLANFLVWLVLVCVVTKFFTYVLGRR